MEVSFCWSVDFIDIVNKLYLLAHRVYTRARPYESCGNKDCLWQFVVFDSVLCLLNHAKCGQYNWTITFEVEVAVTNGLSTSAMTDSSISSQGRFTGPKSCLSFCIDWAHSRRRAGSPILDLIKPSEHFNFVSTCFC